MKSPFTTTQNNQFFSSPSSSSSKPLTTTTTIITSPLRNNSNTHNNNITNTNSSTITSTNTNSYEPTSVLDLRRSPSPVGGGGGSDSVPGFTTFSSVSDESPHLNWNENHHQQQQQQQQTPLLPSEDWDSMIWDLGNTFKVDDKINSLPQFGPFFEPNPSPPPPPQFPTSSSSDNPFNSSFNVKTELDPNHHHQNPNLTSITSGDFHSGGVVVVVDSINNNHLEFDCSQLDQLIRAAESVELNDLHLSQMILARLNQTLQNPFGKPLQRTAYYFKEALQNYLNLTSPHVLSSPSDIVQKIRAYKIFSEISPIPLFANFTANQALLEASDGAMFIHIIDFDIGLGGQWASYMQAIVCKSKSRDIPLPSIRITAIVPEESSLEANLIRENLQQFARELGIRFQLEFVLFNSFEVLLFGSIRFINGEMIAVNLSPSIFRLLSASDSINGFLRFLRRISPQIVVFVDNETCKDTENSSFRRNFINGLEFYSALLESLDAANSSDVNLVRRIEKFLIRPKILSTVTAGRNCISPWRELLSGAGMMPVALSEFTESQADWLVRRTNIRGFHVAKRQGSILLCWQERELVSTSAWMC
ncbi:hypothetical protein MKW94_018905 [Papaver nudicaule]|uniref:Uncharacterized protein n=1 Tax=Papaver nudicaule TaxID=74823 RepID=A0AA42AWX2_PAPNU|nr:hypothetical protein [Papaver nudicaule]